jgi:flavin-dependent dehydrogenase
MYYFPGGYCGLAPMEDGLYNACCLVHRRLARNTGGIDDFAEWLKTVARHGALDARLWGAIQVSDTVATAPVRPARRRAECDGALLVGDAAGFLDPFTGDGISMALHSGGLAAAESARRVGHAVTEPMACSYSQQLGRAVRRSYRVAGLLRALVRAPSVVQALAAAALPWLGARLHAETRWRS